MGAAELVMIAAAAFVGATTQRVSGLGFALTATPFFTLVAGAYEGVSIGNTLAVLTALFVLSRTWRSVAWLRAGWLLIFAIAGAIVGGWLLQYLPERLLYLIIGAVILLAVLVTAMDQRISLFPGRVGGAVAGFLAGGINVTAGVGGPMYALHATADRWPMSMWIGTVQVCLVVTNASSVAVKGIPLLDWWVWLCLIGALALGVLVGSLIGRKIRPQWARPIVLGISALGGAITIVHGIIG